MTQRGVLAVDEGTTGTRAAFVAEDGTVGPISYVKLHVTSAPGGIVEQDAEEIRDRTIEMMRTAIRSAIEHDVVIESVGISTQRMTSVLWDSESGRALAPALVWQYTRYAGEVMEYGEKWNGFLFERIGRGAGIQSPFLWVAHQLKENPSVAQAYEKGQLRFGSIDTWLLWHLTGGQTYATTATLANTQGAYNLRTGDWVREWPEAVGCPPEILPEIVDDGVSLGNTMMAVVGIEVPIRSAIGDQQAGAIGLGAIHAGQVMCVHGTGSFVDLQTGPELPPFTGLNSASFPIISHRINGQPAYAVETFSSTTGSAVDWLCQSLGLFKDAIEVGKEAATVDSSEGVMFVPMLGGYVLPVVETKARSVISGLSRTSTKAHVAHAVMEGIAQVVVSCQEASQQVANTVSREIIVGGGMSASDVLMQMQANLSGLRLLRPSGSEIASLRGAAFVAGLGTIWADLDEAVATIGTPTVFTPAISAKERGQMRNRWNSRLMAEVHEARA